MNGFVMKSFALLVCFAMLLGACHSEPGPDIAKTQVDILIYGGQVFSGRKNESLTMKDVGISGDKIVFVGDANEAGVIGNVSLDAAGNIVTAGFIDPHTHSLGELLSKDDNGNLNYLFQGVTTVFNGNDGGGPVDVAAMSHQLTQNGIGTNTALYIGHGALREHVMRGENRAPTSDELERMSELVRVAMRAGALGLSTGLFYAPGSFSDTHEVIALAAVAAEFGGIYDTHLRDESNYDIGVVAAVDEALAVGEMTGIAVHISHIKALGVDVWGRSQEIIAHIEAAQAAGQIVSADQYPWRASGTHMRNALLPKHLLEGEQDAYLERLRNTELASSDLETVRDNLRRRGGPDSLLIVVSDDASIVGKTLAEVAAAREASPVETALDIIRGGSTRVASFNMSPGDIDAFMIQSWVMTSSDGTDGHPRKYASFAEKYQEYVVRRELLSITDFLFRSSALPADTFGLSDRGRIEVGKAADVIVIDPDSFAPCADFDTWNRLSTGVIHAIVNGQLAIQNERYTGTLAGRVLSAGE